MKHLKELIDEQQWEFEHVVIDRGKYAFKDEYKYLEVCETDWFRMTKQQREKFIQKIANAKLKCEGGLEEEVDQALSTSLQSISAEQFHSGDLKIPLTSIKGIWKKAEELLVQTDAIVAAPGCEQGSKISDGSRGGA